MTNIHLTQTIPASGVEQLVVFNPYDGTEIGRLDQQTTTDVSSIFERAQSGASQSAALPRHRRAEILNIAATKLESQSDSIRDLIVAEAGKTKKQASLEVSRAVNTLRLSAIEAQQNTGELIPFSSYPTAETRRGWFTREPLGMIVAITPYNDALNLVAHKLGPAIAGGNSVILKPAQQTPFVARALVELLLASGLPEDVVTVVHGDRHLAGALIAERQVRMVSFTGGFVTGESIAAHAGLKRLSMELGGNAPIIVFDDANLEVAIEACVSGAFWAAGQNCIGAQRIFIHQRYFESFTNQFVKKANQLEVGDPGLDSTDVGPMITENAAQQALRRVDDAVASGAKILTGATVRGSVMTPTVLTNVPRTCEVWREEVFAPIVILESFENEDEVISLANAVEYSLHAGIFTQDIDRALRVAQMIEAGGVMINDSSDFRIDSMPFGGSKYGSMGREGVRFAYEEMTQPKVISISPHMS